MTEAPSVSCTVDVRVDPHTAFTAFTDEMDAWWMRSPISYYDSSRAIARRCEPGVGGRILEVYDEVGDALELGRITIWEPGVKLQWLSSVDDVEVEVRFAPTEGGTNVQVHARVLPGGDENVTGSFSFVRVVPDWYVKWCSRRSTASRTTRDLARLNLAVYYRRPVAAARWLAAAFGFDPPSLPDDDDAEVSWIEFHVGNTALLVFRLQGERAEGAPVTHMPWVYVDDLDEHLAEATRAGATIVEPIHQYGYRAYVAEDLEGNRWTFAQARPTME
jgi:uncharacterized glyoxalase superfamily protein PhnB